MIIGNNNYNPKANNFKNKMNNIKTTGPIQTNPHKDINNSNEMLESSFNMLQQRLNMGLITYDEFQKQCNKLNKLRK